jgi:hypothetical protein
VVGETGAGKTEIASRAMQHFGREFRRERPPASWMSTGNSLEVLAFTAKDALLLVDDFCPTGSASDVQRFNREADRVLRAQGNQSGRGRLSSDGTLRPVKPPRGLILSTGEDVPRGHSLRARSLIVEVRKGDLDFAELTKAQEDGSSGFYAASMSGYLRSLSERITDLRGQMPKKVQELRNAAADATQHRRTPGIVADLFLGLQTFLEFAVVIRALSNEERKKLEVRAWSALLELAEEQADHHASSEPTARFLELLASAVGSGVAHIASIEGERPPSPGAWGWREFQIGGGENAAWDWRAQGNRVGWLDGDHLYLDRDAAYRACQTMAAASGDGIAVSAVTLVKRLAERGLLASTEAERKSNLVRHTIEGKRRAVVHLKADAVLSTAPTVDDMPGYLRADDHDKGETPEALREVIHVG